MKTFALLLVLAAAACAPAAFPRAHFYQAGTVLSFQNVSRKAGTVYSIQIGATIYKITRHSKKHEFSAGQTVACRVAKNNFFVRKPKGGELKFEILGESVASQPAQP